MSAAPGGSVPAVPTPAAKLLPRMTAAGQALFTELMPLDPRRRSTAARALEHAYFAEAPPPTPPERIPLPRAPAAAAAAAAAAASAADGPAARRARTLGDDNLARTLF